VRFSSTPVGVHKRGARLFLVKNGHCYLLQFGAFNRIRGIFHAIGCRNGGISRPPFDGLNVSYGVGDDPAAVAVNRVRLQQSTGDGDHVYARQVHGTAIRVITREAGSRIESNEAELPPADALITNVPGVRLLIQTADCQAVMLVDPQVRVVANVHSGWRGSVADIIGKTVARMVTEFGCRPGDMHAAIGPSLGPCCAEFVNYKQEIPRKWWSFRVGPHHFDFWRISRHQLVSAGLSEDHVTTPGLCTRCNPGLFYSYRAARRTGRFAALIGMDRDIDTGY
jgi:YfiH family protein